MNDEDDTSNHQVRLSSFSLKGDGVGGNIIKELARVLIKRCLLRQQQKKKDKKKRGEVRILQLPRLRRRIKRIFQRVKTSVLWLVHRRKIRTNKKELTEK